MTTAPFALLLVTAAGGALPQGYFVWSKGTAEDPSTRTIHRLTLPEKSGEITLTAGEDVEPQISPDGRWVAYAKAKFPGGSDYHDFKLWKIYVVPIHGAGAGRREIKIDDDGAWPSWSKTGALFYNQADGTHSRIVRVEIDDHGRAIKKQVLLATRDAYGGFAEVNEAAIAPDETWLAARTRGNSTQNGVTAFTIGSPAGVLLARAGDVGCMPRMAPGGTFAIIAGATEGIRWGHGPQVAARKEDQLLIPARSPNHKTYHPGISTDGQWVLAAQGTDADHNAGRYDVSIYALDGATMLVGEELPLATGNFNGWPHVWVGPPTATPPPQPEVAEFYASSYTVAPGEAVTLTWSTFGAEYVSLDGANVPPEGNKEIRADATAIHDLAAQSITAADSDIRRLTITVNATPQDVVIEDFSAQMNPIEKGRSTTLRWTVRNATTLDLDGQRAAPAGTREIAPLQTTTFVLTAQGQGGPAHARITVVVEAQKSGLLPDRGGFQCNAGGARGGAWMLVLLAGLAALAARTAMTRRRSPR